MASSRSPKLFLAILIVAIVVLTVYVVVKKPRWADWDYISAHMIESPQTVLRRSGGAFDEEAALALALDRAVGGRDPSPMQRWLAASIITNNILGQEHRPELGRDGRPTARALEQTRLRRDMVDRARDHYRAALQGIGRELAGRQRRPAGRPRRADAPPRRRPPPPPEAGALVDAALDFALGGMAHAIHHDPLLAIIMGPPADLPFGGDGVQYFDVFDHVLPVDFALANTAAQTREQVVTQRREAAAEEAGGAAAGPQANAYLDLAQANTNDLENVHDPSVNGCLRGIVRRLREDTQGPGRPTLDAIKKEIQNDWLKYTEGRPDPKLVAEALEVLERARNGERNVAIGATDEEVLQLVWARAEDPRNAGNRDKLKQAVFDNLRDSWKKGIDGGSRDMVCVNGRTGRQLGGLTLLDFDPRNWEVKRLEQFKNDIFGRTKDLIRAEAEAAAKSGDDARSRVGRSFLATTPAELEALGPLDEKVSEGFSDELRGKIDANVDAYVAEVNASADGAIPEYMVDPIKQEARAAVP